MNPQKIRRQDLDVTARPDPPCVPEGGVVRSDISTPVGELTDRYLAALADGNFQQATDQAVEIESSLPPVGDLLSSLVDAARENRVPKVRVLRQQLRERYEDRRVVETAQRERASVWTGFSPSAATDTDRATVETFLERARQVGLRRFELFTAATPLQSLTIEQEQRRRLRTLAAQLAQREELLATAASDAMEVVNGTNLPAAVSVLRAEQTNEQVLAGKSGSVNVVVGNVGDGTASDVELDVTASELSATPETVEVGALDRMTKLESSVEVTASEPGTYSLTLDVTSANAGRSTATVTVTVSDVPLSIAAAYDEDGTNELETEEIQQAVADFDQGGPVPGLERTLNAEELRQLLVAWAYDQPI
jgi:hypothetical protein